MRPFQGQPRTDSPTVFDRYFLSKAEFRARPCVRNFRKPPVLINIPRTDVPRLFQRLSFQTAPARREKRRKPLSKLLQFCSQFGKDECLRSSDGAKSVQKSYLIHVCRRKKFPNSNPKAESAPMHLNLRNFTSFFPPFTVSERHSAGADCGVIRNFF